MILEDALQISEVQRALSGESGGKAVSMTKAHFYIVARDSDKLYNLYVEKKGEAYVGQNRISFEELAVYEYVIKRVDWEPV